MSNKYCDYVACTRKVLPPFIYCDKHADRASTPFNEAEVLATIADLYPDWQSVKLTKSGYIEQRAYALAKLTDYFVRGKK